MATSNPPPEQKAAEIIDKLPAKSGLITKTGTALLGTGIAATAISQELYVVNEESIVLLASIIVFTYIGKASATDPFKSPRVLTFEISYPGHA